MSESDGLLDHLLVMFGEHGEDAPPWDTERKYAARKLQPYVSFEASNGRERWQRLRADAPLAKQLVAMQPLGYRIPGIPTVHIVVRGSPYERAMLG